MVLHRENQVPADNLKNTDGMWVKTPLQSQKNKTMKETFKTIMPISLGLSLGFSLKYIETNPILPIIILISIIGYFVLRFSKD